LGRQAKAEASAKTEADPYGMTNKKATTKSEQQIPLGDDKQKR
jgi:hypothetical protein